MSITLGSNIASLQAQRQLFKSGQNLSTLFERLSSGQRINRASDDAAGLAISESLNVDRRVFNQAIRNLNDGVSLLNIADATVGEVSGIVLRLQELAQQASNGSLSSGQRESLDQEAQALKDEFFRISRSSEFNDLNLFDGSLESVVIQAGYGTDGSVADGVGGKLGTGQFEEFGNFLPGSTFWAALASGDVNGDGNIDFVADVGALGRDVGLFLGNGDGSFQATRTLFQSTSALSELNFADFNNDGILDLYGGNQNSSGIHVALGNGDGTFSSVRTFGSAGRTVAAADVNNDGILDLAYAGNSGVERSVEIALGNGDGTFGPAGSFYANDRVTESIQFGDVNGDGLLDLVAVGNYRDDDTDFGQTQVFLGNGDGTFSSNGSFFSNTEYSFAAALIDINGDSVLDLITAGATFGGPEVRSYLGEGDGTFSLDYSTSWLTFGGYFVDVEFGDFDGDGTVDLVLAEQNTGNARSRVLSGNGDGTFAPVQTVVVGSGGSVRAIEVNDFNGDGVLDLLSHASSQGGYVHLGGTRDGIAPLLDFSLKDLAGARAAISIFADKHEVLTEQRGRIGAFQSRLESALNTLRATSENYAAAESRIRDADIAFETAQLTRLNILQQAASAVLGQANQQPALASQLLQ